MRAIRPPVASITRLTASNDTGACEIYETARTDFAHLCAIRHFSSLYSLLPLYPAIGLFCIPSCRLSNLLFSVRICWEIFFGSDENARLSFSFPPLLFETIKISRLKVWWKIEEYFSVLPFPSSLPLILRRFGVAAATDTSCMSLSCKRAVTRLRLTSIVSVAGQTTAYLMGDRCDVAKYGRIAWSKLSFAKRISFYLTLRVSNCLFNSMFQYSKTICEQLITIFMHLAFLPFAASIWAELWRWK